MGLKVTSVKHFYWKEHLAFLNQAIHDISHRDREFLWYGVMKYANIFSAFWSRTSLTASIILLIPHPESVEANKFLSIGYSRIWIRSYSRIEKFNFIFRDYAIKILSLFQPTKCKLLEMVPCKFCLVDFLSKFLVS